MSSFFFEITSNMNIRKCCQPNLRLIKLKAYQVLHHALSLGPKLPHRGEDIAPSLPLDLLDQDRQPNIETTTDRSIPENMDYFVTLLDLQLKHDNSVLSPFCVKNTLEHYWTTNLTNTH